MHSYSPALHSNVSLTGGFQAFPPSVNNGANSGWPKRLLPAVAKYIIKNGSLF
jgi:hypothetical protein